MWKIKNPSGQPGKSYTVKKEPTNGSSRRRPACHDNPGGCLEILISAYFWLLIIYKGLNLAPDVL